MSEDALKTKLSNLKEPLINSKLIFLLWKIVLNDSKWCLLILGLTSQIQLPLLLIKL